MEFSAFYAYPAEPANVASTIETAVSQLRNRAANSDIRTWRESDVAGRFLADQILSDIASADVLFADITHLNFNVAYEIGFAMGRSKRIVLTRHRGITPQPPSLQDVGIFDTLGYKEYENAEELTQILMSVSDISPSVRNTSGLNKTVPVYLLQARLRTDHVTRIVSRVKKARLRFRSFDPTETPRLSVSDAVENVAQSYGVLLHLIPASIADSLIHNIRAAFLAGLAEGFDKILLLLQDGEDPVPLDYRELVTVFRHPSQIDDAIAEFATDVVESLQQEVTRSYELEETPLERVSFGASAAENEFRDLEGYYLETDQFQRALRGEIRLVVGRKGSGKTAIFAQVRDHVRREKSNVVLDLRPDGYQLLKFKEMVLEFLGAGAQEHTITAFWEYLLLLEVCYKLLEKDRHFHIRDRRLYEPYRKLADLYQTDDYVSEGDFSERLARLLQHIADDYQAMYGGKRNVALSQSQVTEILYRHDVTALTANVVSYLTLKGELWLLFDNIDKGWPSHGLTMADLSIVRALLEATRKIERLLHRRDIPCKTLVFLRNDVFELLIDHTPDRGKEARVALDWSDPDLFRELVRRRLLFSEMPEGDFDEMWRRVCVSHIAGEDSFQYLIDRCLMRPRALIDILNHCRASAVNLRHARIDGEDMRKGLLAYSSDLVIDIGYEIRDIVPESKEVLVAFLEEPQILSADKLESLVLGRGIPRDGVAQIVDILLWYGVLGVHRPDGSVTYIYDVNYEMPILRGFIQKYQASGVLFHVNPAFVPGLQIQTEA